LSKQKAELRGAAEAVGIRGEDISERRILKELEKALAQESFREEVECKEEIMDNPGCVDWGKLRHTLSVPDGLEKAIEEKQELDTMIGAATTADPGICEDLRDLEFARERLLRQEAEFWRERLDRLYQAGPEILTCDTIPEEMPTDKCPLCEALKKWKRLEDELKRKRAQFGAIRREHDDLKSEWRGVKDSVEALVEQWATVFCERLLRKLPFYYSGGGLAVNGRL